MSWPPTQRGRVRDNVGHQRSGVPGQGYRITVGERVLDTRKRNAEAGFGLTGSRGSAVLIAVALVRRRPPPRRRGVPQRREPATWPPGPAAPVVRHGPW